jgi:hypothetical protein
VSYGSRKLDWFAELGNLADCTFLYKSGFW